MKLKLSQNKDLPLKDIENCQSLILIGKSVNYFPRPLLEQGRLKHLEMQYFDLEHFPSAILSSKTIETLSIKECHFKNFQGLDFVFNLNLKSLTIKKSKIENLPFWLEDLIELEYLDLSANNIKKLGPGLKKLKNLKRLILDSNPLEEFIYKKSDFPKLNHLSLDDLKLNQECKNRLSEEFNIWF